MPDKYAYDVFVSHSSTDKLLVRPLAERLRSDGIKIWFDEWEIQPGDSIPVKIDDGLERSRILLLCMSKQAFGSDWAILESQTIRFRDPLNREGRFIPLRLDDAPIKSSLAQFLYINWNGPDREREYAKLLDTCRRSETQSWPHEETMQDAALIEHLARLASTRRDEWVRLKADFETEARKYHTLTFKVFEVTEEGPVNHELFDKPNHAISLWQFVGQLDSKQNRAWARSAEFTKYGATGTQLSMCGVVIGDPTELFVKMAIRAGSLLSDKALALITAEITKKFTDPRVPQKPMTIANANALAKWLNVTLIATTMAHPERLKNGTLLVDPFAASITAIDYFKLDVK